MGIRSNCGGGFPALLRQQSHASPENNLRSESVQADDVSACKGVTREHKNQFSHFQRAQPTPALAPPPSIFRPPLQMDIQDIPVRLSALERTYLSVILATLTTSQYTSKVDIRSYQKSAIIQQQQKEFINIAMGLLYAAVNAEKANSSQLRNLKKQLNLIFKTNSLKDFLPILTDMIEVARRYKIMNPHKMRVEYGKLVHILMDAKVYRLYDYGMKPILTLNTYLSQYNMMDLLTENHILKITAPTCKNKDKAYRKFAEAYLKGRDVDDAIEEDDAAMKDREGALADECRDHADQPKECSDPAVKHHNALKESPHQVIERALNSLADAQTYIQQCVDPLDKMLDYLRDWFQEETKGSSLTIRAGQGGSKLSHDHNKQYKFLRQTLSLWKNVMVRMYSLSLASEQDLFSKDASRYSLVDTGQGLNRIQPAYQVGRMMSSILGKVQSESGRWVGLSVVHLGDRDVPNALTFIDKYRQIPGIVNPILITVGMIPELCEKDEGILNYIKQSFGSPFKLQQEILRDFFRHGFDGSGHDGGSCIDGR